MSAAAPPASTPGAGRGGDGGGCGSSLLVSLPDDVLSLLSASLRPRDLCNLALCCRCLRALAASDKLWSAQCALTGLLPVPHLPLWRASLSSYRALCRFLLSTRPLLGLWVHQNPELGNVVFVLPSFLAVVACRVVPQELGPSGLGRSPLLFAPVFEIIALPDGATALFLHGREATADFLYPAALPSPVPSSANILLLEVLPYFSCASSCPFPPPFRRLAFGDRRKLLDLVAAQVRIKVPELLTSRPLLPQSSGEINSSDLALLLERRAVLLQMHELAGGGCVNWQSMPGLQPDETQTESRKMKKFLNRPGSFKSVVASYNLPSVEEELSMASTKKKTFGGYFKDGLKQILGRSNSMRANGEISKSNSSSGGERKHVQLQDFLNASESLGLSLCASTVKLSCYRAWPNMHDNRFALYKLPVRTPTSGQEYAGLWGGSFGWPPGRLAEDKPGKALFFLLISYEECDEQRTLIATKILEGTHYVLHPNGSAMFTAKVDEPSMEPFPWEKDAKSVGFEIKHAFNGEGIANGYGFRYPGSKPGSLYVTGDGLLAFVWQESRAILTLQRVELRELLKKGERVPALPPIANFSYLTKSYSNVFAGYSTTSSSSTIEPIG